MFKDKTEEQLRAELREMRREARLARAENAFDYLSGCGELTLGKLIAASELSTDGYSRFEAEAVWNQPNRTRSDIECLRSRWLAKLGNAIRQLSGRIR